MPFNLLKKKSSQIIQDSISTSLGFGTKQERLDDKLEQYRKQEAKNAEYLIAERNILLSQLNVKVDYYQRIHDSYQEFIKLCETIEIEAENEIKKPDSQILIELRKPDGTVFVNSTYKILYELIPKYMPPDYIGTIIKQLENEANAWISKLTNMLINGQGKIIINGSNLINDNLFTSYLLCLSRIQHGYIKDLAGKTFYSKLLGYDLIIEAKGFALANDRKCKLILDKYLIHKRKLDDLQAVDNRILEEIRLTKELIKTTEEYVVAKSSAEYLNKI